MWYFFVVLFYSVFATALSGRYWKATGSQVSHYQRSGRGKGRMNPCFFHVYSSFFYVCISDASEVYLGYSIRKHFYPFPMELPISPGLTY